MTTPRAAPSRPRGGRTLARAAGAALPVAIAALGASLPLDSRGPAVPAHAGVAAVVQHSPFAVRFVDVGTGDAALIDVGDQEIVIDGGDSPNVLAEYVARTGLIDGPIELVVVTHSDGDHWKGLTRLLGLGGPNTGRRGVLEFWEPGYNRDCRKLDSYEKFVDDVRQLPGLVAFRRPLQETHPPADRAGRFEAIAVPGLRDVRISVLHTDADPTSTSTDCAYRINNASIVLGVEIFNHRFLFTGDENGKDRDEPPPGTPAYVEKQLLDLEQALPGALRADVLKVPHHGSETANTQAFVDKVDPRFVVVSASTRHHLPKETAIRRYDDGRRVILRTDAHRENDRDHIVCYQDGSGALDCNYEDVLAES